MNGKLSIRSTSLLLAIGAAAAVYLIVAMFVGSNPSSHASTAQQWGKYFGLPWLMMAPVLMLTVERMFCLPVYTRSNKVFLVTALVGLPALHVLIISMLFALWPAVDGAPGAHPAALLIDQGFLLFDLLILITVIAAVAVKLQQQQLQSSDAESYRLGRHLADTKLQNLSMQLNPHFLFNTLNGLSVLIDKQDNERAGEMVGELSKFLRQVLRTTREKWVTLEQELEFIRQYLHIEQYRFGKRLTWFEDCEPLALTAHIPPMLLQPLFENAIVHGLADKQGDCRLAFECRLYDRFLIIHVFDNGDTPDEAFAPKHKGGIGLSNIRARLRELYGDSHSLTIERKTDGTLVTLKLPAFKDSQFRQSPE